MVCAGAGAVALAAAGLVCAAADGVNNRHWQRQRTN